MRDREEKGAIRTSGSVGWGVCRSQADHIVSTEQELLQNREIRGWMSVSGQFVTRQPLLHQPRVAFGDTDERERAE